MKYPFHITMFMLCCMLFFTGCKKQTNWYPNFDSTQRSPYGTYVLYKELNNLFPQSKIITINKNTRAFLEEHQINNDTINHNQYNISGSYLFIYEDYNHTSSTYRQLLNYVGNGNYAFLSARMLNQVITKELGANTSKINSLASDSIYVQLSDIGHQKKFSLKKGTNTYYFSEFNKQTSTVLGHLHYQGENYPNMIRVAYKKGFFILHSEPFAYTNYHMLKEDHYQYVTNTLSYLPNNDLLWDNNRIQSRKYYNNKGNNGGFFNAISFITKNKSLTWAMYVLLAMAFLYLIFNSKRQQRIVKLLKPYPNYSLNFAKNIAGFYQRNNNHRALLEHKSNWFVEEVMSKYQINIINPDTNTAKKLHTKSGVSLDICNQIIQLIHHIKQSNINDKQSFYQLHHTIELFKKQQNNERR